MDAIVVRAMAKWPDVPAVYGWLALDRRGGWRIKGEKISHPPMTEFIARNYAADEGGRWFFQNGPQRVYVELAYTPLVVHFEGAGLRDHCGRRFDVKASYLDDEGSVLFAGERGIALLDDRDLARVADEASRFAPISRAEVASRFGFTATPRPG